MTPYEEMVEAASVAIKRWHVRDASARKFISDLVDGFIEYCQMKPDLIRFSQWMPGEQVYRLESDKVIPMPFAVRYDPDKDEWVLVIHLTLGSGFQSSKMTIFIRVTEDSSRFTVKMGELPPRVLNLSVQSEKVELFADVVASVVKNFQTQKSFG